MIMLLLAFECMVILANFALPMVQSDQVHARASAIAREMREVKNAAVQACPAVAAWPSDQPEGSVPPELKPYLPPGFQFTHKDYRYDWNTWMLPNESMLSPGSPSLAGITLITQDPRLAAAVAAQLPKGDLKLAFANRTTLVIEATSR